MKAEGSRSGQSDRGESRFGHDRPLLQSWRKQVEAVLQAGGRTPFYLFSPEPVRERLDALEQLAFGLPTTFWLSFKTQPLPPLVRWWVGQGRPVEVVSEFEFRAALREGCPVDRLLVNGPAKHRWLPALSQEHLRVNFDSPNELRALLPIARRHRWRTGLRLRTPEEVDPENRPFPTQFGFELTEIRQALRLLRQAGIEPDLVHTHIRTNISDPSWWSRALAVIHESCVEASWFPRIIDAGGGLPALKTSPRNGNSYTASYDVGFNSYAAHLREALRPFGWARELWLEHGRHLSAAAGTLAIRVLDAKDRSGVRTLICDGGRTLQALVSVWEDHALLPLRQRRGRTVTTAVHGPTCMAFDQLGRRELPASIRIGDVLLWMEAGAYHLPWETRFSHGLCEVWWQTATGPVLARPAESFDDYWGKWGSAGLDPTGFGEA